jgi:hypothetical protein
MNHAELIVRARQAAVEIASMGLKGWGNTMSDLADAVSRLTAVSLQPAHDQVTIECLNDKVMYLQGKLDRLTAGDVSLPQAFEMLSDLQSGTLVVVRKDACQDYGDRRAAAAVLAERERCASVSESWTNYYGVPVSSIGPRIAAAIRKGTS